MKKTSPAKKKPPKKPAKAKPSPVYAVPALDRGLDVFEALSAARRPLLLSEIAKELGLAPGVVFRLLARLEGRGYLTRDAGTGCYSLSLRLYGLALAQNPLEHLLRAARLPMERLAAEAKESCHLSVLVGREIVVVAATPSSAPVRLSVEVGSRHPVEITASGRLLVALRPPAEWPVLAPGVPAKDLAAIVKQGFVEGHNDRVLGVHDLTVPVRLADGHAALAVPHLERRGVKEDAGRLLAFLQEAAQAIRLGMGLDPSPSAPAAKP